MSVTFRAKKGKEKHTFNNAACFAPLDGGYQRAAGWNWREVDKILYICNIANAYEKYKEIDDAFIKLYMDFTLDVFKDSGMKWRFVGKDANNYRRIVFVMKPYKDSYRRILLVLTWVRYLQEYPNYILSFKKMVDTYKLTHKRKPRTYSLFKLFFEMHRLGCIAGNVARGGGHELMFLMYRSDYSLSLKEFRENFKTVRNQVFNYFDKPPVPATTTTT